MTGKVSRKYEKWTEEERVLLLNLYEQEKSVKSTISWINISQKFANKTPRQCYDQYLFFKKHENQPKNDVNEMFKQLMNLKVPE